VDGRVKPGHDELNLSIEQKCADRERAHPARPGDRHRQPRACLRGHDSQASFDAADGSRPQSAPADPGGDPGPALRHAICRL